MSGIRRLVLATANPGKAVEVRAALPGVVVETLADHPRLSSPIEDGATFIDNARIKAEAVARSLGVPALADDSGLAVDALDGAPGVLSARYADGSDEDRYRKLLQALNGVPDSQRTARFVCAMAFRPARRARRIFGRDLRGANPGRSARCGRIRIRSGVRPR